MSNEIDLGFGHNPNGFRNARERVMDSEQSASEQEARGYASALGQIAEDVALKSIQGTINIGEDIRSELSLNLAPIMNGLRHKVLATKMQNGKTLSEEAILPYYIDTFGKNSESLTSLAGNLDRVFGIPITMSAKLDQLRKNTFSETKTADKYKIKYLTDSLIIISRLVLNGVVEDLGVFGQVIPDIKFREQYNGNIESTQIDGIFIHQRTNLKFDSAIDREEFIRSRAEVDSQFPDIVPPILRVPAILEIKTNFRPRYTAADLSQHIPPYLMTEMTDRMARALTGADIAIAPTAIILIRLRSLGSFSPYIYYPTSEFYQRWENRLSQALESLKDPEEGDLFGKNEYDENSIKLYKMLSFVGTYRQELMDKEEKRRTESKKPELGNDLVQLEFKNFPT